MLKKEKSFSPRSIVIMGNIINCILAKYRKISTISQYGYSAYFVFKYNYYLSITSILLCPKE